MKAERPQTSPYTTRDGTMVSMVDLDAWHVWTPPVGETDWMEASDQARAEKINATALGLGLFILLDDRHVTVTLRGAQSSGDDAPYSVIWRAWAEYGDRVVWRNEKGCHLLKDRGFIAPKLEEPEIDVGSQRL